MYTSTGQTTARAGNLDFLFIEITWVQTVLGTLFWRFVIAMFVSSFAIRRCQPYGGLFWAYARHYH